MYMIFVQFCISFINFLIYSIYKTEAIRIFKYNFYDEVHQILFLYPLITINRICRHH